MFSFARQYVHLVPIPEYFRRPAKNFFWHQSVLPRMARELKLDVLHIPDDRRMIWQHPCPLVTTIHGPTASRADQPRPLYEQLAARWLARRQNEIIAGSECAAQSFAARSGVPAHRINVVPNGIDHNLFFPRSCEDSKAAIAKRHDLNRPFFLYTAPLEPDRNHVRLIEAFDAYKAQAASPWQLVLAGNYPREARAIQAALRKSPFELDIRCLGSVPDAELAELYRAADVFIYPSLYDGTGMTPLAAMACGCPVISSERGALKEVLGTSAATIDPEDPMDMKCQMTRFAENAELREHWRIAALARAKCFHWQKTLAGTIETYSQAAANSKVSRGAFALAH